jgi:hypothetical protein
MAKRKVSSYVVAPVKTIEAEVEQVHEEAAPEVAAFIAPAMSFADRSKLMMHIADETLSPVGCAYFEKEYLDAAKLDTLVEVYPAANDQGLFPVRATSEGLKYAETLKASAAEFEPLQGASGNRMVRPEEVNSLSQGALEVADKFDIFGLAYKNMAPANAISSHAFEVEDVPVAQARTRVASYDLHRLSVGQSIFIAGKKGPGMIVSQANKKLKPSRFSWAKAEKNGTAGIRVGRVS